MKRKSALKWSLALLAILSMIGLGIPACKDSSHHGSGIPPFPSGLESDLQTQLAPYDTAWQGKIPETLCISNRSHLKAVVQVNNFCRDDATDVAACSDGRAYALGNIQRVLKDFENHGMKEGTNYKVVAVVHSTGMWLMYKANHPTYPNKFEDTVKELMGKGVEFYICWNTVIAFLKKGRLSTPGELIDGVKFCSSGVGAMADLQNQGYSLIQP
jgi:intracellular sulfur oxidation DsrE/DsrF family protein